MKKFKEENCHVREKSKNLSKAHFNWDHLPTKFLLVHKEVELDVIGQKIVEVINWLVNNHRRTFKSTETNPSIYIFSDSLKQLFVQENFPVSVVHFIESQASVPENIDLILTFGGDGTVLNSAWLFQQQAPPIIPFHFGTLGFLTVFHFDNFAERLEKIFTHGSRINVRMRLSCTVYSSKRKTSTEFHVLNEIVIERGASPFMCVLDLYGDERFLTTVQADGIAVATPTGSTAYSLSAGGSVVHPDVTAMLVTPICPHSLSFRPVIVPETLELKIHVSPHNRGNVWLSFDGRSRLELEIDDYVIVKTSEYPILTLCRENQTADWFHSLSRCLHWNER